MHMSSHPCLHQPVAERPSDWKHPSVWTGMCTFNYLCSVSPQTAACSTCRACFTGPLHTRHTCVHLQQIIRCDTHIRACTHACYYIIICGINYSDQLTFLPICIAWIIISSFYSEKSGIDISSFTYPTIQRSMYVDCPPTRVLGSWRCIQWIKYLYYV